MITSKGFGRNAIVPNDQINKNKVSSIIINLIDSPLESLVKGVKYFIISFMEQM